ncbi:hypothetical protein EON80_14265 [bacterium]|nr:MAG: hypothetical protein EON80_14265 [bacterium]
MSVNTATAILEGSGRLAAALTDGDIVVVPRSKNRILVVGAVTKPGSYALPEDRPLTVGDALSLAGGPQNTGRVRSVTLLRPTGQTVTQTLLRIDKPENGVFGLNQPILTGDVIYVPEGKPRQSTLSSIFSFLPAASVIFNNVQ